MRARPRRPYLAEIDALVQEVRSCGRHVLDLEDHLRSVTAATVLPARVQTEVTTESPNTPV